MVDDIIGVCWFLFSFLFGFICITLSALFIRKNCVVVIMTKKKI